jgi:hypothetical protein
VVEDKDSLKREVKKKPLCKKSERESKESRYLNPSNPDLLEDSLEKNPLFFTGLAEIRRFGPDFC